MEDTKCVVKPGMEGARVNHVRHRKLAYASEALKYGRLDDIRFIGGKADETVNWISNSPFFAHWLKTF